LRTEEKNMANRGLKSLRPALLGLAAALACVAGTGPAAKADFLFSPTGTGAAGAQLVGAFDPNPGNALAKGGVTAINNFLAGGPAAGNTFQLYYQATMAAVDNPANQPITTGTFAGLNNTYQITVVASITEVVTSVSADGTVAKFAVAPVQNANSTLQIFQSTGLTTNDLTGAGFRNGTLILTATPTVTANGTGGFINNGPPLQIQPFDQHGTNDYPLVNSVTGNGSSTVDFTVNSVNSSYFPNGVPSVVGLEFITSNVAPLKALDPSRTFPGLGPAGADVTALVSGPVQGAAGTNGVTGPDFAFAADAFVTPIPEPSSVFLMGLGVAGVVAYARKRRPQVG